LQNNGVYIVAEQIFLGLMV